MTVLDVTGGRKRKKAEEAVRPPAARLGSSAAKRQRLAATTTTTTTTMLNGYRGTADYGEGAPASAASSTPATECPVAPLANMGNTCFLNSVIYTLRFVPAFAHNLHHLIDDLLRANARLGSAKVKSASLGRGAGPQVAQSSRSTSSKDLLSLTANDAAVAKSKVQLVTEKFHELFMTLHNLEESRKTFSSEAYQPFALMQAVREANSIFEGHHQQDAHELLVYLLDNIRETCDLLVQQRQLYLLDVGTDAVVAAADAQAGGGGGGKPSNSKLWNMRGPWSKIQKKKNKTKEVITEEDVVMDTDDSNSLDGAFDNAKKKASGGGGGSSSNFIVEDFEGVTLRRTRCLECERVTEIKEPFYDIPVPIAPLTDDDLKKDPAELYRRACVTKEKLCDSNKYLCDTCNRYNEATREVAFEKLPNIMVLQLKRFTATSTSGFQKVNAYMPTPLDLSCFCEQCYKCPLDGTRHRYRLCCVIMHLGGSLASGHYIAYARVLNGAAANAQPNVSDAAAACRDETDNNHSSCSSSAASVSNSDRPLGFLRYFGKRDAGGGGGRGGASGDEPGGSCRARYCCEVRLGGGGRNSDENNGVSGYARRNRAAPGECRPAAAAEFWLECDDENIRRVAPAEMEELLGSKKNSTSTPYLLFYSKVH